MAIIIEDAVAIVDDSGNVMFLDSAEEIEVTEPVWSPIWSD